MPVKLSTTIGSISSIPNPANSGLVYEFYEYMKSIGTSENYQNGNLKIIIYFAKFIGPTTEFSIEDVGIPKMFAEIFSNISDIMKNQSGSIKEEPYRPKNSIQEIFRQQIVDNITIHINNPKFGRYYLN